MNQGFGEEGKHQTALAPVPIPHWLHFSEENQVESSRHTTSHNTHLWDGYEWAEVKWFDCTNCLLLELTASPNQAYNLVIYCLREGLVAQQNVSDSLPGTASLTEYWVEVTGKMSCLRPWESYYHRE